MIEQFYFKEFSKKVKWFQVLLWITNNSIKHHSFVYTELNENTVIFQIIQFSLTAQFKCQTVPYIGPYQVLPLWAWVELGAMAMKVYSVFPKASALLKPDHQIV